MSPTASIPRFLLPQRSAIWRTRLPFPYTTSLAVRHASKKSQSKNSSKNSSKTSSKNSPQPIVLEQPTKFNPPSHGSRLRKEAPKYPGPQLSAEEEAVQKRKKYPTMMPSQGTFMHWFLHNRTIHMYIALSTLFTLAATVWITNFKQHSPFADMLPHWSQLFIHPIQFTRTCIEILRLQTAHVTAETKERRKSKVDDVQKRSEYRKAHGLDKDEGFGGWLARTSEQLVEPDTQLEANVEDVEVVREQVVVEKKPLKKWLGIW